MAKILLVEDDENISNFINDFLTSQNHEVEAVNNGADANDNLRAYFYDLIILDVGLPDTNGLQLCKDYRARGGNTPIIFLTGKNETADLEKGLDVGGDDYVTKPFEMRVLAARIKAILRRPPVMQSDTLTLGEFALDSRAKLSPRKEPRSPCRQGSLRSWSFSCAILIKCFLLPQFSIACGRQSPMQPTKHCALA